MELLLSAVISAIIMANWLDKLHFSLTGNHSVLFAFLNHNFAGTTFFDDDAGRIAVLYCFGTVFTYVII